MLGRYAQIYISAINAIADALSKRSRNIVSGLMKKCETSRNH